MKNVIKLTMMMLAVTMLTMSSCSKEDTYQRRIIGKWECIHQKSLPDNPTNIDLSQYDDSNAVGNIWEFSNDGIFKETTSNGTSSYTYTITEDYLSLLGLAFHIQELTSSTLIIWFGYDNGRCLYYEFQRVR